MMLLLWKSKIKKEHIQFPPTGTNNIEFFVRWQSEIFSHKSWFRWSAVDNLIKNKFSSPMAFYGIFVESVAKISGTVHIFKPN